MREFTQYEFAEFHINKLGKDCRFVPLNEYDTEEVFKSSREGFTALGKRGWYIGANLGESVGFTDVTIKMILQRVSPQK